MFKRIVRNFAALFSGEVIARICHFVSIIYLARILGAAGFGAINFSLAVISYFLLATNLGLAQLGIREVARRKDIKDTTETVLSVRLLIAIISFLAIIIIARLLNKSQPTKDLIILYGISLFPYALSLDWVFKGIEQMKYNAYGRIMNGAIYIIAVVLIIKNPSDILKAALITITADIATSVFYYVNYVKKFGTLKLHIDFQRWISLVSISSHLFLGSALIIVYFNFGIVALGFMRDEATVGIYGAAYKLIFTFFAVSDVFVSVIFPAASRFYHESRERLQDFLNRCIKVAFLLGLPVIVGGSLLGNKIIHLIYGTSYANAGPLLCIMSWFGGINLASYILTFMLVACDRQNIYLKVLAYGALLNVIFNLCAIPFMGYYAPAIALVLTEAMILVLSLLFIRKIVAIKLMESLIKPFIAAMLMGIAILVLYKINLIALIGVASILYFGVLVAIGGISKNEIAKIREAVNLT